MEAKMFRRTFSVIMTPAMVLMGLVAPSIYLYVGIKEAMDGSATAAIFWFLLWGHIISAIISAIIVLPVLAILAVLAGAATSLITLAFRMQKRGLDSLPFRVSRKD